MYDAKGFLRLFSLPTKKNCKNSFDTKLEPERSNKIIIMKGFMYLGWFVCFRD